MSVTVTNGHVDLDGNAPDARRRLHWACALRYRTGAGTPTGPSADFQLTRPRHACALLTSLRISSLKPA